MRIFLTAIAALLLLAFAGQTAQAREQRSGFLFGSSLFKSSNRQARLRRVRKKRAILEKRRRAALRRRSGRRVVRRTVKRRAGLRRTVTRRKTRRRVKRRSSVKRTRVASRKKTRRSKKRSSNLYKRQVVKYRSKQKPGTIVVDTKTRHLYYVLNRSKAIRYGVAVGKQGFAWSGVSRIRRKVEWPTWTPPREMIKRKPELAEFAAGMPGGPQNPLGARALYLFQGKKDTLYRIHGTNNPSSIGRAASSGCIRMRNADVAHLYARVGMGAKVIVR